MANEKSIREELEEIKAELLEEARTIANGDEEYAHALAAARAILIHASRCK